MCGEILETEELPALQDSSFGSDSIGDESDGLEDKLDSIKDESDGVKDDSDSLEDKSDSMIDESDSVKDEESTSETDRSEERESSVRKNSSTTSGGCFGTVNEKSGIHFVGVTCVLCCLRDETQKESITNNSISKIYQRLFNNSHAGERVFIGTFSPALF